MPQFTYRTARSGSFVVGISAAILIETAVVHLLLYGHSRIAALVLTALSLWAIAWLTRDYLALGNTALSVNDDRVDLRIGRRYSLHLPRSSITRVSQPTFRDLPAPGTNGGRDYLNLMKPATPNVLLTLQEPIRVRITAGFHRTVSRLALHLDDPSGFVNAMRQSTESA